MMATTTPAKYTAQLIVMEEPWVDEAVRALAAEYSKSLSEVLRDLIRAGLTHVQTGYERERLASAGIAEAVRAGLTRPVAEGA